MPTLLTDARVRAALKDRSKRTVLTDTAEPGLRLTIGARTATWSYMTTLRRAGVRTEHFTAIGRVEDVSLAMARLEAKKLKAEIREGVDPKAARKLAQARATTLGRQADAWKPIGRARHVAGEKGMVKLALAELEMVDSPPEALTRRDLLRLIETHRSRPATCRGRLGALRRLCDNLVSLEILETNPVRLLPHKSIPPAPTSREGYPSAAQAQRLWHAADGLFAPHRDIVRLLMLVPLRRGEMTGLVAGEIDLERAEVRLAASRTKNKQPFAMPLSRQALDILAPRLEGLAPEDRLFATPQWSTVLPRWRNLAKVARFGLHDLRRLFASECGEHGLGDFDLIDGLLAHAGSASRPGVSAVYQRSARASERRQIMQAWADLVAHAVEHGRWSREVEGEEKVVPLRKSRRQSTTPK